MARETRGDEVRKKEGFMSLDTPPTGAADTGWPESRNASVYARQLATQWRSLLEESSRVESESLRTASLLFRPRPALGLEPVDAVGFPTCRPGQILDEFELIRLVGQGGMGLVWEARQRNLGRLVALKLVRPDRISPEALEFFGREGRAAARLRHPGIVTVHAMGATDGIPWIAQEFVEGECTLADFLRDVDAENLPNDFDRRIALFFFQLCEALAYAHAANVTHRDLKPENVLVAEGDRPKLADFGLAQLEEEGANGSSVLAGTPNYMSPEQALGRADDLGRQSDVFSLGTMLYQALTLELPFQGESLPDLLEAVVRAEPISCRVHRPAIPADLGAIVERAMDKELESRYATMGELSADLAAFLDGRPVSARPLGAPERITRWAREHVVGVGIAVAMVALVVFGGRGILRAKEQTLHQRFRIALLQADASLDRTGIRGMELSLARAEELMPDQPQVPLRRAGAFMRTGQQLRALSAVAEAKARGYDEQAPLGDDSLDSYLRAVYLMTTTGTKQQKLIEQHLHRALEIAPELRSPWYVLYMIQWRTDRIEEGIHSLNEFAKGLRPSDPLSDLVVVQRLELEHRFEEAIDRLDKLRTERANDLEALEETNFYRVSGRMNLRVLRARQAIADLERAVELVPYDAYSWSLLSAAHLFRAMTPELERDAALAALQAADDAAVKSALVSVESRLSLQVRAHVEAARNQIEDRHEVTALDALEAAHPGDAVALELKADSLFDRAAKQWDAGDYDAATAGFERGLQVARHRVGPFVMLGQQYGFVPPEERGSLKKSRGLLREGLALIQRARNPVPTMDSFHQESPENLEPGWEQALLTTLYYVEIQLEEYQAADRTRAKLERLLEETSGFLNLNEQITFAEGLVIAKDVSQRDAQRARELYEGYRVSVETPVEDWSPELAQTVENVRLLIEETERIASKR